MQETTTSIFMVAFMKYIKYHKLGLSLPINSSVNMASTNHRKRPRKKNTKELISFANKFRLPTTKESFNAVGVKELPNYLKTRDHFQPVPKPTCENDWLAMYNETGQTFKSFVKNCPWLSRRKAAHAKQRFVPRGKNIKDKYPDGVIYIQPLGEFCSDDSSPVILELARYAECFFSIPVAVLPNIHFTFPTHKDEAVYWVKLAEGDISSSPKVKRRKSLRNYRLIHRWQNGHLQIQAGSIHNQLQQNIPDDALCLVGLTMVDLYEDESDLFVAGLAAGNRRVAVFSFARYDPTVTFSNEFWFDIKKTKEMETEKRRTLVLQRSCKLLVHEIAHLFGVDHCIWYSCCMNGSGHLEEDFAQPMFLCPVDLHKLEHLCGFDVVLRYKELLKFCEEHGFVDETTWLTSRLEFITDTSLVVS